MEATILKYLFTAQRNKKFVEFAKDHPILGKPNSKERERAVSCKNYIRDQFLEQPGLTLDHLWRCNLADIAESVEERLEELQEYHSKRKQEDLKRATPSKEGKSNHQITSPKANTPAKLKPIKLALSPSPGKFKINQKRYSDSEDESINSEEGKKRHTNTEKFDKMSISTHSSIPVVAEYSIDFDNPVNAPGIFSILCEKVQVAEHECHCQKVFIKVPNIDVADWFADLHSAKLLPDFSGIEITCPVLPHNERDRDNVQDCYLTAKKKRDNADDKDKESYWYCEQVHLTQLEMIHKFENSDVNLRQTIVYHFPKGMTCNNQFFNEERDSRTLTPKMIVGKRKGNLPLITYACVYEMVVDNTVTKYGGKNNVKKQSVLSDLLSGMSFT